MSRKFCFCETYCVVGNVMSLYKERSKDVRMLLYLRSINEGITTCHDGADNFEFVSVYFAGVVWSITWTNIHSGGFFLAI